MKNKILITILIGLFFIGCKTKNEGVQKLKKEIEKANASLPFFPRWILLE